MEKKPKLLLLPSEGEKLLMMSPLAIVIVMLDWVLLLVQVAYLALGQYHGPGPGHHRPRPGHPAPDLLPYSSWEEPSYLNFESSEIMYKHIKHVLVVYGTRLRAEREFV